MNNDYLQYIIEMTPPILDDLMKRYGRDVWNFAYVLTKNRVMSDDITQDVFLQAYRHIHSFRGEASVKTWLLKITRNISFNYRNSAFFRKITLVDFIESAGNERSAEEIYLEQEAANEVWKYVLSLSTKYREVLILEGKYDMNVKEMARLLGISEGTVKSRLHRARKKMAALMAEEVNANETI